MRVTAILLLAAFMVAVSGAQDIKKRNPDFNGERQAYDFVRIRKTWGEAKQHCEAEGMYLAIVNSVDEAAFLKKWMAESEPDEIAVFLGFHDMFNEGEYITIFNEPLEETGFYYWGMGQPDDFNGAEDCGALRSDGFLADVSCEDNWMFFCESN